MQIQITQVNNGYLVATPTEVPQNSRLSVEQRAAIAQQPTVHYCYDYNEICDYIKAFFPPTPVD